MMMIKRVLEDGTCVFCDKEKEVAAVVMNGQSNGEILLCWADVRKMAHMQMRMHGDAIATNRTPPTATVLNETENDES